MILPKLFYHKVPTVQTCILTIQVITIALWLVAYPSYLKAKQFSEPRNISIEDGLSQISVTTIAQDHDGNLWLGTQAGVDKFNGYDLVNLNKFDYFKKRLSGSLIYDVEIDPITNDLWIATIGGLDKLDAQTEQLENIPLPLSDDASSNLIVRKILFNNDGTLWVGTNHGIYTKHTNTSTFTRLPHTQTVTNVMDLLLNTEGILTVASKSGLSRYDIQGQRWLVNLLSEYELTSLAEDDRGVLWVGSNSHGVFTLSFDKNNRLRSTANISVEEGLQSSLVNGIVQLQDKSIWVATAKGINVFDTKQNVDIENLKPLIQSVQIAPNLNVISMLEGKDGSIFYGTFENGLNIIDPRQLIFNRANIANSTAVYDIEIINNTQIVASTNKGLWLLDKQLNVKAPYNFSRTKDVDISYYTVTSMLHSDKYNLTFLASKAGLGVIDHNTNTVSIYDLEDLNIYSLAEADTGNIWLGTYDKGLLLYDPQQKRIISTYEMPLISHIHRSDDDLLIATVDGLYILNLLNNAVTSYKRTKNDQKNTSKSNTELSAKVITWVSELANTNSSSTLEKTFLLGTLGNGLIVMSFDKVTPPTFTPLFNDTKLGVLSIGSAVQDTYGDIWVSTNNSIAKINPSLSNIEFFDKHSGVNPSGYFIGAQAVNSRGRIFFPGVEGLTHFHPDEIQKPASSPNLQISKITTIKRNIPSAQNKHNSVVSTLLTAPKTLELSADVILVSIHFATSEFNGPEKIAYAYRLLGFDDRWQNLNQGERSVTFTNLSPGKYQLELKSTNRYDEWSGAPISLNISVTPPWWKTKTFIVLLLLCSSLLVYFIFKWRTQHLQQQSEHLALIIAEKTNELAAANKQLSRLVTLDPLTGILNRRGFNDAAKREFAKLQRSNLTFSIVLLDIDYFKLINDTHGHDIGDCVLKQMAQLIQRHLRSLDIFSRWGGEEFIILMPNTTLETSADVAEKLRVLISDACFDVGKTKVSVTITSGVAEITEDESLEDAIRRADKRLYQGKRLGRDTVIFEDS